MAKRVNQRVKSLFAGVLFLVLGIGSFSLSAQETGRELVLKAQEYLKAGNDTEAAKLYRKAAELGDTIALFNLASFYFDSRYGEEDLGEIEQLFIKAAEQGYKGAYYRLATLYKSRNNCDGDCVAPKVKLLPVETEDGIRYYYHLITGDCTKAAIYYRKAAELGNADACLKLGKFYEQGVGVPLDRTQAKYWYEKALENGEEGAKSYLEWLEEDKGMTRWEYFWHNFKWKFWK